MDASGAALVLIGPGSVDQVNICWALIFAAFIRVMMVNDICLSCNFFNVVQCFFHSFNLNWLNFVAYDCKLLDGCV